MKTLLITIPLILMSGCGTTLTGYDYKIRAVYEAPQSQLKVTIESEGQVEAGADTSDSYQGLVRIGPLSRTGKDVLLTFSDINEVSYKIESGSIEIGNWGFKDNQATLTSILKTSGYSNIDENEIRELIRAIGGAFGGPKGVVLEGQSQFLKVIEVHIS